MSRTISIASKPEGDGAASNSRSHKPEGDGAASDSRSHRPQGHGLASSSQSHKIEGHKPKIAENIVWRRDGEADQLIIVSREDLPLPLILNPTAAMIFSLCDGRHSLENIAERLCQEYNQDDFSLALEDVKKQIEYFVRKGIVDI